MSKNQTPLTRKYWKSVGGTLIEEYSAVQGEKGAAPRYIDAVIIRRGRKRILRGGSPIVKGKEIIVVQTEAGRLGMYLLGQALFSRELMKRFKPKSIKTVALCESGDSILGPIAKRYSIDVVTIPARNRRLTSR